MPSVALIGPDGAGKTTITRMLEQSSGIRFKYLYMGIDIPASNVALPTARWVERLKSRRRDSVTSGGPGAGNARDVRTLRPRGRAGVRSVARLGFRLADEWFRQVVSWTYQIRGFAVLYDRHFVFDFAPEITGRAEPLDRRIHRWCLHQLYPQPNLVIFLDAPGALLFARKGESTVEELERRRQGFLQLGKRIRGFVRVDATKPLPEVYAEVAEHISRLCNSGRGTAGTKRMQ